MMSENTPGSEQDLIQREQDYDPTEDQYDLDDNEGVKTNGLDADSAPYPKDAGWNYRDYENRQQALNMACATVGATSDAAQILAAAKQFEAFLKGEEIPEPEKPQYPYEEEDGSMRLAANILVSQDMNVAVIGRRIYRFAQYAEN